MNTRNSKSFHSNYKNTFPIFVKQVSTFSKSVSTQDQPESQVFSRLAWSSYIQAFSVYLLDLTVFGCTSVINGFNVKLVVLLTWVLRPVK